jgi:SAM-dependent methyltransferase
MSVALAVAPTPFLEEVPCYRCGDRAGRPFIEAQDDLTGKPGTFQFVRCDACGLTYQNPRVSLEHIRGFYDDEYIAHRKTNWGFLNKAFDRAMNQLDASKDRLVSQYMRLDGFSEVLDVGCGVGTFLRRLRDEYDVAATGVDFKNLASYPALEGTEFHCGLLYDAPLADRRFDLVTMWHFLEHDYDPLRSLRTAHRVLVPGGQLVIEVPRLDSATFRIFRHRWPGLQAPQHTVLYDREQLLAFVARAGFELVDYLPYGAFPAYFYLFTGTAFLMLKGRGLNLKRAIYPYFAGKVLTAPIFAFEKYLNLAMQTVICRRPR